MKGFLHVVKTKGLFVIFLSCLFSSKKLLLRTVFGFPKFRLYVYAVDYQVVGREQCVYLENRVKGSKISRLTKRTKNTVTPLVGLPLRNTGLFS